MPVSFGLAAGLAKCCPCQPLLCEVAKSCLVSPFGPASIPPIMPNSLHEKD